MTGSSETLSSGRCGLDLAPLAQYTQLISMGHPPLREALSGPSIKCRSACFVGSLIPSSVALSWGTSNDRQEAPEVLAKASTVHQPQRVFADAGYDAKWVHEFCRESWQVESVIKPAIHRSESGMNGKYRSGMTAGDFNEITSSGTSRNQKH